MRYVDEFRSKTLSQALLREIDRLAKTDCSFMEVCGTHTVSIFKFGIRDMLPSRIRMLSGPGCPVCVTPQSDIDSAIELSRDPMNIILTFGDMVRVPGTSSSLEAEQADGGDIRVVYSSLDALDVCRRHPNKRIIFFAIGFETTSPTIAQTVLEADRMNLENFFLLCSHKLIPPAMQALIEGGETDINGFICPGHVSTIIGSRPYQFIPEEYNIPCVITGFEPVDVLQSIYMLLHQLDQGVSRVEIQYTRCVRPEGNKKATRVLYEVFEPADAKWRGFGVIPKSGLRLRGRFRRFDIMEEVELRVPKEDFVPECICGEILRGIRTPYDCLLFGKGCTPEYPIGPCMVSSEGTCSTYYKYGKRKE